MRRVFSVLIVLMLFAVYAEGLPKETYRKCPACGGRGRLVLTPPDYGQHEGEINAAKSKRWDVKVDPCPICKGKRRLATLETSGEPQEGESACSACGWSGAVACRKCKKQGTVKCEHHFQGVKRAIRHLNKKQMGDIRCKDGWIITEYGYNEKHIKKKVEPCPECRGTGLAVCRECEGRQATVCKKCLGEGHKVK